MVVQVFPFDRRLRNLPPVLGGASQRLGPLLLAASGPVSGVLQRRASSRLAIEPSSGLRSGTRCGHAKG